MHEQQGQAEQLIDACMMHLLYGDEACASDAYTRYRYDTSRHNNTQHDETRQPGRL